VARRAVLAGIGQQSFLYHDLRYLFLITFICCMLTISDHCMHLPPMMRRR
jgi:hypothetical protein